MTDEDINKLIALDQGWEWRWSAAKGELRWYSPEGHNFLLPPDYCGDEELMRLLLNKLAHEDKDRFEWVYVNMADHGARAKAVAYVKMLGVFGREACKISQAPACAGEPGSRTTDKAPTAVVRECFVRLNPPKLVCSPPTNS